MVRPLFIPAPVLYEADMSNISLSRPIVKLRPGKGRRLRTGAPWAFADEIAMDRRARKHAAGSLVQLVDGTEDLGLAAFNPDSQIAARLLDPDAGTIVDASWFEVKLRVAMAMRDTLFDAPFYRLVHAEADGFPGVVIDRFGDTVVIQPNAAWIEALLEDLIEAVQSVTGCSNVVVNATSRTRKLEGLEERLEIVRGSVPEPIEVPMNGAIYLADVTGGQKTGLFYDQRPNHAFVQRLAREGRMLDLFCHVGGFGLAALAGGAQDVLAIDGSAPALTLAEEGAKRLGVSDRLETRRSDAFDALAGLAGESFDVVVCDPPAFAPNKNALEAGLRAYQRVARMSAGLVRPGGYLVLCSCSHAAGVETFHKSNTLGIGKAGRTAALIHSGRAGPDHPVHLGLPETSYLKALVYRVQA
ncbi:MAG: class I SAM-dependent rRNA methyltransferase [Pseudomonadota bacterium]